MSTPSRRSDVTRAAILDAARRRFASTGYERTTIRAVAADAGIDPSMVMRYYGSKEGLFGHAVQEDLALGELATAGRDELGAACVRVLVDRWDRSTTLPILLRAATSHPGAADQLRHIYRWQLAVTVQRLVGDDHPAERASLLASQALGIALCRYVLGIPELADADTDTLVRRYAGTFQRYLTDPLA